ncbi:helix-turn-helix transcriptional regulator [Streptomyces sp. SRF1]|nr:helix-turn-helix transcriptional regulator [Streptomyces sp. SRF1]MDN3059813.1 helix-turn-helix transcriptional regulator [Streptomyces sp. SRF1]
MERREGPLDPAAGPVQRFAYELRKLRQETEGLTYRAMAQRTEYSVATLSRAAVGEQLPSLGVVLAYARACGADPQEWERRWRAAAGEAIAEPGTDDVAHAPRRGRPRRSAGRCDGSPSHAGRRSTRARSGGRWRRAGTARR